MIALEGPPAITALPVWPIGQSGKRPLSGRAGRGRRCFLNNRGLSGGADPADGPAYSSPPAAWPCLVSGESPYMDLAKNLKIDSVSRLNPSPPLKVEPGQT